ncbi:23S rRNA pseudouridine(2604) synthase RluF [Oceanimonas sp. CHS3-5]|uniref:23S rRNA pseudouridine(2604) synthase RluF n=1 Tax=Oceanimonas sp. CHS3-5 TaxID=3068186 RepID=UPI00273F687E|nr:23S rRNA pseudouridine(2604) synthase RluF [Oceanimonas sp. CHS3-5]MDP5292775.1 23S rRNA pseudouridine(2604) synthase RluF [Oceanimonas sp. CHS3-5]
MTDTPLDTRLNKFISETGICSRREADRLIEQGLVRVNGEVAGMGVRVSDADDITVRGKPLRAKPKAVYLVYNKPVGITCTTDRAIPENIVDAVNYHARIFPIGRLDKPSCGLILLTNDGDIVNKILRAGNAHEKEYIVSMDKPITDDFVAKMSAGVPILDTVTKPCKVRKIGPRTINIILTQGLNRQIRRMAEYLDYRVTSLKRVRIMNIQLGSLKPGQWRYVSDDELALINRMIAGSSKTEEASVLEQPRAARQGPRKPAAQGQRRPASNERHNAPRTGQKRGAARNERSESPGGNKPGGSRIKRWKAPSSGRGKKA